MLVHVSPACAGIGLLSREVSRESLGFPRLRGDWPSALMTWAPLVSFPPPARGLARAGGIERTVDLVSPACAGIGPHA